MTLVVALAGFGLLQLPWLLRGRLTQLSPGEWTRSTSVNLRVGLALVQFGLLATAAPTVLSGAGAHDAADTCSQLLGPSTPGGDLTGWVSLAVLGWMLLARWRARRHVHEVTEALRIEPWAGSHTQCDGYDLAVIPASRPLAYPPVGVCRPVAGRGWRPRPFRRRTPRPGRRWRSCGPPIPPPASRRRAGPGGG